jgi:hypothetical protein
MMTGATPSDERTKEKLANEDDELVRLYRLESSSSVSART